MNKRGAVVFISFGMVAEVCCGNPESFSMVEVVFYLEVGRVLKSNPLSAEVIRCCGGCFAKVLHGCCGF